MSFNAIHKNKILVKISEFTVIKEAMIIMPFSDSLTSSFTKQNVSGPQFLDIFVCFQVSKSDEISRQLRGELASIKDEHSRSSHDVSIIRGGGGASLL